jgi:dolichol-phosphate mannosyltransferase
MNANKSSKKTTITDCFVSVVAPLYNDEAIVEDFITEVTDVLSSRYSNYELVLVDDGSTDKTINTVELLLKRTECTRLIILSRNYGEEIAISAGLDSAIGDFVVVMLPDSDPPQLIPEMVSLGRSGNGVVFGVLKNYQDQPWWSRVGSDLFHWYCERALNLNFPKYSTQFKVLSRQAVNAITQIRDRYRYIRIFTSFVGYSNITIEYEPKHRSGKPRQRGFLESVNLAIDIVVANSKHPLRFVTMLGLLASILNLMYIGYIILVNIFKRNVMEGWTTSSLQNAGMFFFILLILTVISEYIGRILEETKDRPLYYVIDEKTSSVMLSSPEIRNVVTD